MRLVIVKETNTVGKDGEFFDDLDLSTCNLPNNLWALQWYDNNTGHIEFDTPDLQNEEINTLPEWANNCIPVWEAALAAKVAAEAAAAEAARIAALPPEEEGTPPA